MSSAALRLPAIRYASESAADPWRAQLASKARASPRCTRVIRSSSAREVVDFLRLKALTVLRRRPSHGSHGSSNDRHEALAGPALCADLRGGADDRRDHRLLLQLGFHERQVRP